MDFNKKSPINEVVEDGAPPIYAAGDLDVLKQQGVAPSSGARDVIFASEYFCFQFARSSTFFFVLTQLGQFSSL